MNKKVIVYTGKTDLDGGQGGTILNKAVPSTLIGVKVLVSIDPFDTLNSMLVLPDTYYVSYRVRVSLMKGTNSTLSTKAKSATILHNFLPSFVEFELMKDSDSVADKIIVEIETASTDADQISFDWNVELFYE